MLAQPRGAATSHKGHSVLAMRVLVVDQVDGECAVAIDAIIIPVMGVEVPDRRDPHKAADAEVGIQTTCDGIVSAFNGSVSVREALCEDGALLSAVCGEELNSTLPQFRVCQCINLSDLRARTCEGVRIRLGILENCSWIPVHCLLRSKTTTGQAAGCTGTAWAE